MKVTARGGASSPEGARLAPSSGMSDTTATPPGAARPVTCPFCFLPQLVATGDELCRSCGLDMQRLAGHTPRTLAETANPRPVAIAPPAPGGKKRRKKRGANPVAAPAVPWAGTTPAGVAGDAMSFLPATPPPVVVAPPTFATSPAPAFPARQAGVDEATILRRPPAGDIADDATVVAATWALEFRDGVIVSLPSDDVVIGRRPDATGDATPVSLPDPSRSLSRTHARLRRDATRDIWTIEDLASSNGVATVSDTGVTTWLQSGVPAEVSEYFLLGDIQTRLTKVATRDGDHETGAATSGTATATPESTA